jgi:hypothetical protein
MLPIYIISLKHSILSIYYMFIIWIICSNTIILYVIKSYILFKLLILHIIKIIYYNEFINIGY